MSDPQDINSNERTALINELTRCLGTMTLEHQEKLLEYFVDTLLTCEIKPSEVIFYRREPSGNEWHGVQLGADQYFGIGCIKKTKPSQGLRVRARSINQLTGTWVYNWDVTSDRLQLSRDNQIYTTNPDISHMVNVLEDILDYPQNIRYKLQHWLKYNRNLTIEELEEQAGVIEAYVQAAALHGLGRKLQILDNRSYGFDQDRWFWRRMLKIESVGSNRLLLTSHGLPVSSVSRVTGLQD